MITIATDKRAWEKRSGVVQNPGSMPTCEDLFDLMIALAIAHKSKFKRSLKALYDLRSRAVHRAQFGEVQLQDLEEFSRSIAWLIVSMTALTERGYRTLDAIKEQVLRLDGIVGKKTAERPGA